MFIESLLTTTFACCCCCCPANQTTNSTCCPINTTSVSTSIVESTTTTTVASESTTAVTTTTTASAEIIEPVTTTITVDEFDNCAYWSEDMLPRFEGYLDLTWDDLQALYNCVEHEVGGCSQRSKYIVTASIINRCLDGWAPTVYDVISAPNQYQDIFDVLYLTDYATYDTIECVNYVLNTGIDFSNGATSFYNRDICGWIDWFENQNLVAELDGHRYFRL